MIDEILTAAGIPERGGRMIKAQDGTFAVWFDDITTDGPDGMPPVIFIHDVSLELYEPKKDPAAVRALEAQLTAHNLHWTKTDRVWIQSEQFYETVYSFQYIEKRRTM